MPFVFLYPILWIHFSFQYSNYDEKVILFFFSNKSHSFRQHRLNRFFSSVRLPCSIFLCLYWSDDNGSKHSNFTNSAVHIDATICLFSMQTIQFEMCESKLKYWLRNCNEICSFSSTAVQLHCFSCITQKCFLFLLSH